MLKINTIVQSKKITQAIFTYFNKKSGEKRTLNGFRSFFVSQFGFSELQDAFTKSSAELKANYITYVDDHRITIEVARDIQEDYDKAKDYFETHLKDNSEDIMFPIQDTTGLLKRCEEILILFNEIEYYNVRSVFTALCKVEVDRSRIAYKYNTNEPKANPELMMFMEFMQCAFGHGGSHTSLEFFEKLISFEESDIDFDSGFIELRKKIRAVVNSVIWTQTNVGRSHHQIAHNKFNEYLKV